MYYRKIIGNTFKYLQILTKSNYIPNISVLKLKKNTFVMVGPQMSKIKRHYGKTFQEQKDISRTILFVLSGSFLFNLFDSEETKDDVAELEMTIKRSILLIQRGEFPKAEQMLHVALRQAQTLQHYDGITYVYDVMANLAYSMNDFKKAEKLFVSVLQRLISKGASQDDLAVIHISLKIATMYNKMEDTEKAENGYKFCLKNLQNHMVTDSENRDVLQLLGLTLESYAAMLLLQSHYTDAMNYLTQAYDISVKINGEEHEQTVVLLNDLGTVNCMVKEYDQAIKYLSEATEIGKKLPEMSDIGTIQVNLGNAFIMKGLYEQAKKNCIEGKRLGKANNHKESVIEAEECLEKIKKLTSLV
ncbi:tetratricopeptide repeat protein 19 homolog, mitochondrial-like isoform X1 [Hylaeus volcanicus]|uniref:tetratricopeptide repeat protein 19 homolog, mitochondrial isoform X1 n=2 Tax=Hylaeus volcanicus TaxID=313075 RepID=UPI0023B7B464|nr:tetratricopeptide repeat protein 19 homolog, mitochondrial isoform X1 [Hylaeus volcanicus]XP_053989646.1 tetratricopeptide repeat protein 19 homolog, mitochondrial-like isoform X1 [Hylaeus volcanicus]